MRSLRASVLSSALLLLLLAAWPAAAQTGCRLIYPSQDGWAIDLCTGDSSFGERMTVWIDGADEGLAAMVRVYHATDDGSSLPQVAVFNASGYVRLKQNADPAGSPIPFGSSFVLGPGYWPSQATYHHSPQIATIEIDTSWLPGGPLRLTATGSNHDFGVVWEMTLPEPRDRQTRLHVSQTLTANAPVTIDATRQAESQGLKLVQVSSMFIGSGCNGGLTGCHDSDALRLIGADLERRQVSFDATAPGNLLLGPGLALGSTWVDVLHTDDAGWQGNTPNVRIALDALDPARTLAAQGFIAPTTDPNDDNVGVWVNEAGAAIQTWTVGETRTTDYWLLAQDDPPEPWAELGLRSGATFLDFEGSHACTFVRDVGQATSGSVGTIDGYTGKALRMDYDLGSANGNWVQIRCDFSPALDLSAYDHLRFDWIGSPGGGNSLEIGVINPGGRIFGRGYHHPTHHAWWGQLVVPFQFLEPWTPNTTFDPGQVSAIFFSVVKDPVADVGGTGSLAVDNLNAFSAAARPVPAMFERARYHPQAAARAAAWLASRQRPTGFLDSWEEEAACQSYTYDQALALIVFARAGMWAHAGAVVNALVSRQNANGSWFRAHDCETGSATNGELWEGDIAWAVFALSRYLALGGPHSQAAQARDRGADWLLTRLNPSDGCLVIDHTEGTIDAWWALRSAGPAWAGAADGLRSCLLTHYWDAAAGRFKGGRSWWAPYLDNQTWGAPFLAAIDQGNDARRALSHAREVLLLPAQGGQLYGLDGQGGPWSVWNEGVGQYVAAGGPGAADLLREALAQQREDGAMPASPDEFNGGGVWTPRWHGVAPTAWFYLAQAGEPFPRALSFHTITPCRLADTRPDTPLQSGVPRSFPAAGSCGIPATAQAVSLNLTIVGPTGLGHATLYPAGHPVLQASTINFGAGAVRANNAIVLLSADGRIEAQAILAGNGQTDLILDVNGYFE